MEKSKECFALDPSRAHQVRYVPSKLAKGHKQVFYLLLRFERRNYCSFAYSAFACCRMGMSGSAFFQKVR